MDGKRNEAHHSGSFASPCRLARRRPTYWGSVQIDRCRLRASSYVVGILILLPAIVAYSQDGTTGFQYDNAGNLTAIFTCDLSHCGRLDVSACPAGNNCCACRCSNPNSDPDNCGSCGHVCSATGGPPHASRSCGGAPPQCGFTCDVGYGPCVPGQCVPWDVNHCGSCSVLCSAPDHGFPTCTCNPLQCGFGCNPSYTACPTAQPSSCVDTSSDINNCGTCGHVCTVGQACCGGACVDLQLDPYNCGSCGRRCGAFGESGICTGGVCCATCPLGNCDATITDGCGRSCLTCGGTCCMGACCSFLDLCCPFGCGQCSG